MDGGIGCARSRLAASEFEGESILIMILAIVVIT